MSRKYKFGNSQKPYFVSFATVRWVDLFTRNVYRDELVDSLRYCQKEKELELYAWCIMPSHVHLIISSATTDLASIMRDIKGFTSKKLRKAITENPQESRREWLLNMFEFAGKTNNNNQDWQLWQQDNHPIELYNADIAIQKLTYLHNNPVEAGFVDVASAWLYSSARDYEEGRQGLLEVIYLL
jgi:REP element-mobilizing transposase RayT